VTPDSFEVRPLRTREEMLAAVELQRTTWGESFSELVPATVLALCQRFGGVSSGAFDSQGRLVGFVFGLTGWQDHKPIHWSDMLAVVPVLRNRNLGEKLKRHQRDEMMSRGIDTIFWTFDPLVSRNAFFNLARLGAIASEYRVDEYCESDSILHRGIGTDRLVATWLITSDRVLKRLDRADTLPTLEDVRTVPLVNDVVSSTGFARSAEPDLAIDAAAVRVAIPTDIQALKESDIDLAVDWRTKTRSALLHYIGRGYTAVDLVRESGWSSYLLRRDLFR
jgi:predicted GNAT superfamily acetyltransferase